jgi:hypothetical protein
MNMKASMCAASGPEAQWEQVNWSQCELKVRRLQARIVKATQEGRHGKVKALRINKESTDTNTRVQERVQAARIDYVTEEYEEHNAVLGQRCIRIWMYASVRSASANYPLAALLCDIQRYDQHVLKPRVRRTTKSQLGV